MGEHCRTLENITQANIDALARIEYGGSNGEWSERITNRFDINTGGGEVGYNRDSITDQTHQARPDFDGGGGC